MLTPRFLNVKLGPPRNYHKGQAVIRHYANQTPVPYDLRHGPNFTLRDLVGAFSVITILRMELFEALLDTHNHICPSGISRQNN